jgi:hypothetical protein
MSPKEWQSLLRLYGKEKAEWYARLVDSKAANSENLQKVKNWHTLVQRAIREKWGTPEDVKYPGSKRKGDSGKSQSASGKFGQRDQRGNTHPQPDAEQGRHRDRQAAARLQQFLSG